MSIYDEYSNDILDMPEGSCFPRPQYRRNGSESTRSASRAPSFSKPSSFKKTYSRSSSSLKSTIGELKPLELLDGLFRECHNVGERMVSEGLITRQDIEEAKSGKGSRVISIGFPAYCMLQALIRSAKADCAGILINDDTELSSTSRPSETFFDWFLNPLLIIKEQIKAENLSPAEEDYLGKLVLWTGDLERIKGSSVGPAPEPERRRAELDGLARRLQGIMKSMSRFPTFRRRFDYLVKTLSDDLAEKHGAHPLARSKSAFARMISFNSFKGKRTNGSDQESSSVHVARDLEIS